MLKQPSMIDLSNYNWEDHFIGMYGNVLIVQIIINRPHHDQIGEKLLESPANNLSFKS